MAANWGAGSCASSRRVNPLGRHFWRGCPGFCFFLSMEQLTPELERRLQVEELWARRNVLNDSMNARRCERFRTRHQMLSRLGTQALPLPAHMPPPDAATDSVAPVVLTLPARPMRPIPVPDSPGGARRVWGVAGLAAAAMLLLAIGFQNNDMIAGARAQWQGRRAAPDADDRASRAGVRARHAAACHGWPRQSAGFARRSLRRDCRRHGPQALGRRLSSRRCNEWCIALRCCGCRPHP